MALDAHGIIINTILHGQIGQIFGFDNLGGVIFILNMMSVSETYVPSVGLFYFYY